MISRKMTDFKIVLWFAEWACSTLTHFSSAARIAARKLST